MPKKGFTIVEVLVSAMILAVILVGIVNVFITGKRLIQHSRSRMSGVELGKIFLTPLQDGVRVDTWGTANNPLQLGREYCDSEPAHAAAQHPSCPGNPPTAADRTINNIIYDAEYNISNVTARGEPDNIRRVVTNIRWNEPVP